MAILTRQPQKVFASSANADQLAVFGTMKTGTPVYSSTLSTLQSADYLQGWSDAILDDKAPYLEEMNAVQYGLSYQIAYLLQEGIPAYDSTTEYSNTSIVKVITNNELELYHSLQNGNIGNALSNTSYWARVYFTNTGKIGEPQITLNFNTLPANCIWLEGQAVSRSTYSALYAIYGTSYGSGDGSTTFNLPNFQNRTIWGGVSAGYLSAGIPNITGKTGTTASVSRNGAFYSSGNSGSVQDTGGDSDPTLYFNANNGATVQGIYRDDATTVQPPSIKVRVYTRYQ